MNSSTFPKTGLSVESTVCIVAEYDAASHSVKLTINGGAYEAASKQSRQMHAAHALDVLLQLESTLVYQYDADIAEVERLISAARNKL